MGFLDWSPYVMQNIKNINTALSNIGNASPKGVYATLADLQVAHPTGVNGVYLVVDDGHWYYWDGSAWADGGAYQTNNNKIFTAIFTSIADETTNIVHNLNYNPTHDDLIAFHDGLLLSNVNFTYNADDVSIDLKDWALETGDKIVFRLYKDVK